MTNLFIGIVIAFVLGAALSLAIFIRFFKGKNQSDIRSSPHYLKAMVAILQKDKESALIHLTKVAESSSEATEVYLALGDLYRERGQLDRAIRVHQSILARPSLNPTERVLAKNAIGADFKAGGFIDRAQKAFEEVLALEKDNSFALENLVKISEDLGEWNDAYQYEKRLQKARGGKNPKSLSYLLTYRAQKLFEGGMLFKSAFHFYRAIRLHRENMLAYHSLAKVYSHAAKFNKSLKILKKAIKVTPHKAFMIMDDLKNIYHELNDPAGYLSLLDSLSQEYHLKRANILYIRELMEMKEYGQAVIRTLAFLGRFPRCREAYRLFWKLSSMGHISPEELKRTGQDMAENEHLSDSYTCINCGYSTIEILHRCPNCKDWNSLADLSN